MPRQVRIEFAGAFYHVMCRGDRREAIFQDNQDRERFLVTLGEAARRKRGNRYWQHRVYDAIESLRALTNFDHLYIGGGNARLLEGELPPHVSLVSNTAGILGGARLWN